MKILALEKEIAGTTSKDFQPHLFLRLFYSNIEKLREAFKDQPVYIKFIGLDDLEKEAASQYNAVVMLNKWRAQLTDVHPNRLTKNPDQD